MKTSPLLLVLLTALPGFSALAQTAPMESSARQAFRVAKDGVDPSLRSHIVSIYGVGGPTAITTWYVMFYDPSTTSHGRAVKVQNGQIVRTYSAHSGVTYNNTLTFDPSQISDEGPALAAAQNYATQHSLAYDHVRALLRLTTKDPAFRWRIQLMDGHTSRGFVFANATDGTFAMYAPPDSQPSGSTGTVEGDAKQAGRDIKNTFLGIGGDLQQFFTGERTVDQ
jgi:hypothetical protein